MIYPLRTRMLVGRDVPFAVLAVLTAVVVMRIVPLPAKASPPYFSIASTSVFAALLAMFSTLVPHHVRVTRAPDSPENAGTTPGLSDSRHPGEATDHPDQRVLERDRRIRELTCELEQAKRLADIGRLAAGVAHELNNPLGGIIVYANLLLEDTEEQDHRSANIKKIIRESERCRKIVASLLDIARQSTPPFTPTEINRLVGEALDNLRNEEICRGIRFDIQLGPDAGMVMCDSCQMQEVFENLISNAAEAMAGRGTLSITSGCETGDAGESWTFIRFADEGPGIPEKHLERIFEPFFSMKTGHGTGLGLSVSSAIVRRHGGTITAENRPGTGALFTVRIPKGETSS